MCHGEQEKIFYSITAFMKLSHEEKKNFMVRVYPLAEKN